MAEEINVTSGGSKNTLTFGWTILIIVIIVLLVGGGIAVYYFLSIPESGVLFIKPKTSATSTPSTSATEKPELTNKYLSSSTCIQKFSFEYPSDWMLIKDYSVMDSENGGEGGACALSIKFAKEDAAAKNTYTNLNVFIEARSSKTLDYNIDQFVQLTGGPETWAELVQSPSEVKDITLGGEKIKQYLLSGMYEWYYLGVVKNKSYFQITLLDLEDIFQNARDSKTGYEIILNSWKFL